MTGERKAAPYGEGNAWRYCYGQEAFDLRLTLLRMLSRLPLIVAVTVLGMLVFGGGYYVKNVLLRDTHFYAATSVYRVEYAAGDVEDMLRSYINEMSWNTYVQSQMFLDMVQSRLGEGEELTDGELAGSMEAFLWSDVRVPAITVTTEDAGETERIIRAVDLVMTQDFTLPEIASVSVIDPGRTEEVLPDVRVGNAFVFSGVLSCFCVIVVLLLKETGDACIWLPGSVGRRYGLRTAGTLESRELAENLRYFFYGKTDPEFRAEPDNSRESGQDEGAASRNGRESDAVEDAAREDVWFAEAGVQREEKPGPKAESGEYAAGKKIAACMVQEGLDPEDVLGKLRERCPEIVDESWFAVESPLKDPGVCTKLRQADGILLAVRAGAHAGKKLEYVLEYLGQQDCEVTAVILWEADEKLIRRYYFGRRQWRNRSERKGRV